MHSILKSISFPILPICADFTDQLLLAEVEQLQVTTSLFDLHKYIAKFEAQGRNARFFSCIIERMESVAVGLWKLPESKYQHGGLYNAYMKMMIRNGNIHIWNKQTSAFEKNIQVILQRSGDSNY